MMPRNSRGPLAPIHVQKHTVSLKQPLCSTNNDCVAIMITLRDDDTAIDCQHLLAIQNAILVTNKFTETR